jgi:hypothetical protein
MKPGDLVEIRNPFCRADGARYDERVDLGIVVHAESEQGPYKKAREIRILVDGGVRIFLDTLWDITPVVPDDLK